MQVLFGQKYGFRPFPVTIDAKEFEALREALIKDNQDVSLLDQWFQRDDNIIPPVHALMKISTFLPNWVNTVGDVTIICSYLSIYKARGVRKLTSHLHCHQQSNKMYLKWYLM